MTGGKPLGMLLTAILAFPSACTERPDPVSAETDSVIRRDSAGVEIVEVSRATLEALPVWTLDTVPTLVVGRREGPPAHEFTRFGGAVSLPDGGLAAVDWGATEIRTFNPDGTHRATAGRRGEGPGEFGMMFDPEVGPADSIYLWDDRLRRLSVLTPDLEFARSVPIDIVGFARSSQILTVMEDGTIIFDAGMRFDMESSETQVPEPFAILPVTPDGEIGDTIATRLVQMFSRSNDGREFTFTTWAWTGGAVPSDGGFWYGYRGSPELEFLDFDGVSRRLVRFEPEDREITEEEIDAYLASQASARPDIAIGELRADFERAPRADSFPAFGALSSTPEGGFWLGRYDKPSEVGGPSHFFVFAQDGEPVAQVEMPAGWGLREVREDDVLVMVRDEFDVQQVRRHRIIRGTPAG